MREISDKLLDRMTCANTQFPLDRIGMDSDINSIRKNRFSLFGHFWSRLLMNMRLISLVGAIVWLFSCTVTAAQIDVRTWESVDTVSQGIDSIRVVEIKQGASQSNSCWTWEPSFLTQIRQKNYSCGTHTGCTDCPDAANIWFMPPGTLKFTAFPITVDGDSVSSVRWIERDTLGTFDIWQVEVQLKGTMDSSGASFRLTLRGLADYLPDWYLFDWWTPFEWTLTVTDAVWQNGDLVGTFQSHFVIETYPENCVYFKYDETCSGPASVKTTIPLVLIPGIMGTHLWRPIASGVLYQVWYNIISAALPYPFETEFDNLKFQSDGITPVNPDIVPHELMGEHAGDMLDLDAYSNMIENIENAEDGSTYIRDQNFFTFPYDWRFDNTTTIAKFNQFVQTKIPSGKFDVVAHSMGGLIVKKWAEDNPDRICNCFFVGTPHNGSSDAMTQLIFGNAVGPLTGTKVREIASNMISANQLLPNPQYAAFVGDCLYSEEVRPSVYECSDFHTRLPNQTLSDEVNSFQSIMASPISGIDNPYLIVGWENPTVVRAWRNLRGKLARTESGRGDGTVPFFSAIRGQNVPSENIGFLLGTGPGTTHGQLCNNPAVIYYVLNRLGHSMPATPTEGQGTAGQSNQFVQSPESLKLDPVLSWVEGVVSGPVAVHMYDRLGNHTGVTDSGWVEANIPGTNMREFDGGFYFYCSDTTNIRLEMRASDSGAVSLFLATRTDSMSNVMTHQEAMIDSVLVRLNSSATASFSSDTIQNALAVDFDGDGTYEDTVYTYDAEYLCGDADGGREICIADVVYLISYIFSGGSAPNPLAAGDADCSGDINIADVVYLVAYIFSGGLAPCAECE